MQVMGMDRSDICPSEGGEGFSPVHPSPCLPGPAGSLVLNTFTAFSVQEGQCVGGWGPAGKKPPSPFRVPPSGNPRPPFPSLRRGGWSRSHPGIIQACFPFLSFSEKLCVSTGVAGVRAPRDCACTPAWEEKCLLGENLSQARHSPRAQERVGGKGALGEVQVAGMGGARLPHQERPSSLPRKEAPISDCEK